MEHWSSKNEFIQPLDKIEFRPIRTEAERKRLETEMALRTCLAGSGAGISPLAATKIYDAIAAGKIPGVKLEAPDDH